MKITVKTLQQNTFKVDIDDSKTVKELKEKIESDHGKEYPCSAQKLIYSGKILADESKLAEYSIDEKKFIVLMITRPPPAPKVAAPTTTTTTTTSSSSSSSSSEKPTKDGEAPKVTAKKEESAAAAKKPADPSATAVTTTPSSATTTTSNSSTTSSTTTTTAHQQPTPTRPSSDASRQPTMDNSLGFGESPMASRLAAMMNMPHFRQIQDLIQQSPHLLSSTIEALAGSDPELFSFISENPDDFVHALNHPPMVGSRGPLSRGSNAGNAQMSNPSDRPSSQQGARNMTTVGGRQQQQPVVDQVLLNVSDHDKEAIERLKELGFSEYLAVQAYIACDKDEQLAANLLFQMEQ